MHISSINWPNLLAQPATQTLLDLALSEDIGSGDITTQSIFRVPQKADAVIAARTATVACGAPLIAHIFQRLDPQAVCTQLAQDGSVIPVGGIYAHISGDVRALLSAERCALNFAMRLCGIAQSARQAVSALPHNSPAQIYDTRKTLPGWRALDKAAVRAGGARNHRTGLFDAVLIKDNHIAAAGSVRAALQAARAHTQPGIVIEVEVDTMEQFAEALACRPDIILLDNFSLSMMNAAVTLWKSNGALDIQLEVSGGVTQKQIAEIAATGVHRISMGALTHSVMPADLGFDFIP